MQGRIVADPRSLVVHAGDLGALAGEFEQEAYRLREALGFFLSRPDIPNGPALMSSYTTALQSLDSAAATSRQLSGAVVRHAQRVVDCENSLLRSGDGIYARPITGRSSSIDFRAAAGLSGPLGGLLTAWGIGGALGTVGKMINLLPALTLNGLAGGSRVVNLLNNGSVDDLAKVRGISKEGAEAIIAGRRDGRYRTPADVRRALSEAQTRDALTGLRKGPGKGTLDTTGPLGKLAARLGARIRGLPLLGKPLGSVAKLAGRAGSIAAKLGPVARVAGKILAPLDVAMSGYGAWNEWHSKKNDPNLPGGDNVEDVMAGASVVVSVAGAAVAVGLIANPVGIAVVAGAAVGIVAYQYGPRAWKAGSRWAGDAAGWVGDRAGDAKDYVSNRAGDVKDAVSERADDVKDAVSHKADDAKDWAGSKASGAKKKISGWFH